MPTTVAPTQRPAALAVRRTMGAALRLTRPVEARISPDGHTVAVCASGQQGTSLVLAAVPASSPPHATPEPGHTVTGPRDTSVDRHSPRWLPDSRTLLHVAEPGGPGHPVLAALDTATGEVRVLARAPGAVEDLLVSDDGLHVLLLCAEDGAERDGMHLGLPVRLGAPPAPERFAPGTGRRSVWTVDLADGALRPAGPEGLTVWNVAWRGGNTAVATVSEESLPAGYYDARFVALDLTARTARTLLLPDGQLGSPALSRDGRHAAVCEGISIVAGRPVVVELGTGRTRTPADVEDATWLGFDETDGASPGALRWAGWEGTGSRIGRAATTLWSDAVTLGGPGFQPALSFDAAGRLAATVLDAPGRPPEAVVARTDGPRAWHWTPVTALNSAAREDGTAPLRTRATDWLSADGRTVRGLLLDDGADAADGTGAGGQRAARPLAVLLHGGPAWLWSSMYAPADVLGLAPALAAAGYLVLLPNPRGSNGRGRDHARSVVGDTGGGDLDDVLSGVRHLVGLGLADARRTAVLGHSYGGYLAALAAARTDVFAAAVVVSAPTDWLSFSRTSNIGGGYDRAYRIGGAGHDPAELLRRSAVSAHGGSGTPTLLVHGAADRVTPVGQAHELYRALLRDGRAPAELLVYPDEGHEFTDPDHVLDAASRVEEWLATHLGGARPDPPSSAAAPRSASPRAERGAPSPSVPERRLPRSPSGTDSPSASLSHRPHHPGKEHG
ncbi:S9 family peptidase [Streptomyces sp. NBC_00102]|uniref:alpha/beta hydrolase family protein n=1 Tax=Streptomyces sp. NBC_00102 TaxID=2975652 RepID=UPI00225BAE1E|nr:alpha/beta fold hydrolase [Streptomyces sp. NBC_00102]MCX5395714.1 alpha/beta fold hydrolase [Streptomyces sp. NBC_00102]